MGSYRDKFPLGTKLLLIDKVVNESKKIKKNKCFNYSIGVGARQHVQLGGIESVE